MANTSASWMANGNINPSVFVEVDSSADFKVIQATSNARTIGVAQEGTDTVPIPGNTTYAAIAGEPIRVYGPGDCCLLTLGTGGATAGDQLIADSNGAGVTAASSGATVQWVGAIAQSSGNASEKIQVVVVLYPYRPALS